jgi:hypothetical protein
MPPAKRDNLLKKLAGEGLSCSVIAGHFRNCSRNAVIGRLHRIEAREGKLKRYHGTKHKVRPARDGITSAPKAKSKAELSVKTSDGRTDRAMVNRIQVKTGAKQNLRPYNIQMAAENATPDRVLPAEKRGSFDPLPGVKPLPIIDLPARLRCRWPIDLPETKTHFACGAVTCSDTHVYCATHRQMSIGRPTPGA